MHFINLLLLPIYLTGPISTYWPNDGHNQGEKSCRGTLSYKDTHVALREWRLYKCGTKVIICTRNTKKCALSFVGDSGPWGAQKDKEWKIFPGRKKLPQGYKWRAVVDIPVALWKQLGQPRFLSEADIWILE